MSQEIPIVFPTPQIIPQETSSNSHHPNGSFGSVFIVLAIIIVISAIACFLGRLGSKRSNKGEKKPKDHKGKEGKKQQKQAAFPKKEWEPKHNQTRDGDIEFGFDSKRVSSAKVAAANNGHVHPHPPHRVAMGPSRSFKGDHQMRFPGGGDAAMMAPGGPMRFPGGDAAMMAPGGPMRFPGGDAGMMGPGGPMRFPGGAARMMGPGGPMGFPGGDTNAAAMGPSRSFRNGEFRGDQMSYPEGGGEHMHRAGPVTY